jgi:hypothetical protein
MRNRSRSTPVPLQALRDSQRELWKQKCLACGTDARSIATELELRARVRELEWRLKDLEDKLNQTQP